MSLFKKKNNTPALFTLLDNEVMRAKEKGIHYFYYLLQENELKNAQEWCLRNAIYMTADHKTDNNIIYKFIFNI